MYRINELYDLEHTAAKDYLLQFTYPWEALSGIKDFILKLGESLDKEEYTEVSEHVWIHNTWCTNIRRWKYCRCLMNPNMFGYFCIFFLI